MTEKYRLKVNEFEGMQWEGTQVSGADVEDMEGVESAEFVDTYGPVRLDVTCAGPGGRLFLMSRDSWIIRGPNGFEVLRPGDSRRSTSA